MPRPGVQPADVRQLVSAFCVPRASAAAADLRCLGRRG